MVALFVAAWLFWFPLPPWCEPGPPVTCATQAESPYTYIPISARN